MRLMSICGMLIVLFAFVHPDGTADEPQTYTYKTTATASLQLDVFSPAGDGNRYPAIILFHGGSWISGDKAQLHGQCKYFSARGMVAVTANYRLLGKDTADSTHKEICIMDARSAVRWVKSHAGQLHIDTARIILGGASAGGHLATMAVLNPAINDAADDPSVPVSARALVLFNPAYNISENPATQPYRFVDAHCPPLIMFFGSRDKWKAAADSFALALKKHRLYYETWVAAGETHGFFNKQPWNNATCAKAQDFLAARGLVQAKSTDSLPAILTREF
ncbi:MAG: alpha/beta hydrolase [Bacteroidetes bacterium]|nr:alpha/beta hydrolase [Bacteroidota bacterium]